MNLQEETAFFTDQREKRILPLAGFTPKLTHEYNRNYGGCMVETVLMSNVDNNVWQLRLRDKKYTGLILMMVSTPVKRPLN
jgi:hypothetical protein